MTAIWTGTTDSRTKLYYWRKTFLRRFNFCCSVGESCLRSLLHQNYDHQIVLARLNFNVSLPYERKVCHFKKANVEHFREAINGFHWEKSFENMNINDMVQLLNKTIKNIL